LTRRSFLSGIAGGSLAIQSRVPEAVAGHPEQTASPRPGPLHRIGALLPGSRIRPTLGVSLLAGLQLGFAEADDLPGGRRIELIPADTGIGPGQTTHAGDRLLREDRVAVLTGATTARTALQLADALTERGATLVVSDAGADVIDRIPGQAPIFFHTLGYWQASWAMGAWAARNLGRRATIVSSLYESGYDSLYAFRLGFEEAGGEVVDTCVTHGPPGSLDVRGAIDAIRAAAPDFVYALYGGTAAVDFVRAYADARLARRIPLTGAGFLTDETLLPAMGAAALGIRSCLSWAADLPTAENRAFTRAYRRTTGEDPDVFAVLGYETARLITGSLAAVGGRDPTDGLREALATAVFRAPRGQIAMHKETHVTKVPLYLREVRRRGDRAGNEVVAELGSLSDLDRRVATLRSGLKTGWLNGYASV
jgi:branched-chain amino acid transport system substrate-binding protein